MEYVYPVYIVEDTGKKTLVYIHKSKTTAKKVCDAQNKKEQHKRLGFMWTYEKEVLYD